MGAVRSEEEATYPCPACGAKLWAWVAARDPGSDGQLVLDRCEECGLTVTRAPRPPDVAAEIAQLPREGDEIVVANRHSFQGGLGGAQWAALNAGAQRLYLTPRSAELLLRERGIEVLAVETPFSRAGYRAMVETFVNAFTLHDNFVAHARAGRIPRGTLKQKLSYGLDVVVGALAVLPAAIVAAPLELLAVSLRRGGVMRLRVREP